MSGKKLVVIDDDPEIRDAMSRILAGYDYEVFTAEDGSKGLELVARENPSIVLTDIKMPGMDGIEVLKRVKEQNPDAEVIVVTGHGEMDLAIQALQLEASDFINKPISKQGLTVALRRAEERTWLRNKLREHTEVLEQMVVKAQTNWERTMNLSIILSKHPWTESLPMTARGKSPFSMKVRSVFTGTQLKRYSENMLLSSTPKVWPNKSKK